MKSPLGWTSSVIACVALFVAGCGIGRPTTRGSGIVVSETRDATSFTSIVLAGFGTVRLEQTGTDSVTVEAEDNLLPLLVTQVENGTLKLGVKPNVSVSPTRPVIYHVTVAHIDAIDIAGSGNIEAGALKAENFRATISGSGDVKVDALGAVKVVSRISGSGGMKIDRLEARELKCDISGSGNARFAGRADEVDLGISGSGSCHAAELQCRTLDVTIAGSGNATVNTAERLTADVSGSGSVRYVGNPRSVNTHFSGSGSVSPARNSG
jgi:hypothetical protein